MLVALVLEGCYGHADKRQIMQAYDPDPETKKIYKHMENYIDREQEGFSHNTNLSTPKDFEPSYKYMSINNFEQALKERNYWRNARQFIDSYTPKEIDTYTQQENNIAKARKFARKAYKYVGDIISRNNMSSSDPRAIAMHGVIGGTIAKMCGKYYIQGEELGEINKAIVAKIYENRKKIGFSDSDVIAFSRQLGEQLGNSLGLGSKLGGEIAEMATRWNDTWHSNANINLASLFSADTIQNISVHNYDSDGEYKVGHTSIVVTLYNGKKFEIDYGAQVGMDSITVGGNSAKGELKIQERTQEYFDNMKSSMTVHKLKNATYQHKQNLVSSVQRAFNGSSSLGDIQRGSMGNTHIATSKDVNYKAFSNNCTTIVNNIIKETCGFDASNSWQNYPDASRATLNRYPNIWSLDYYRGGEIQEEK